MRVLFLLIGFFVAGLSAWQNEYAEPKPIDFGDNIAYRYHYSGYVLTGLPHINQQQSGYQVISEVFLTKDDQGWIVMKFVDPKLSKVHGIIPEGDHLYFAQDSDHDFVREISKPVRFQLRNGVFTSLEAGKDDPFWSVNMKKSVIDILQVDLKPQKVIYESSRKSVSLDSPTERLVHYSTYEDGIKGVCETTYERFRTSDPKNLNYYQGSGFFALNLTKTRNYRNCLHESVMIRHNLDKVRCSSRCQSSLRMNEFDQFEDSYLPKSERLSRSTYGCECDSKAKPSPVEQFSTVRYNITYETEIPHIEGIIADGKMYIDNHGYNFVVKTHQNLSLIETKRTSYASIVSGSRGYRLSDDVITYNSLSYKIWDPIMDRKPFLDIPYYHLFFYPEQEELVEAAKKHLDQIVEDIIAGGVEESKKLTYKINKLTEILGFLDVPHFDDFFKTHVDIQEDSSLSSIRRQIFFDLLPYAGTNHAALFIGKLIEAKKIDEWEIRTLVESLPKNLYHPSREVVEKYFELVSSLKAKATSGHFQIITPLAVSWAKMVKTLCGNGASGYHGEQLNSMFVKPSGRKDRSNDPRARFNSFVRHSFNFNCTVEDVHRYADTVNGWMESDVSFDLKLVWGQVLTHMGNGYALNLLKPHLSGSNYGFTHYHTADYNLPNQNMSKQWEEYNFFRTALIYALHNVVDTFPTLLKTMTLPIFRNHGEPYELRLAAFTLFLVSGPEQHELESVATVLKYEHNHQVINMVRSLLHNAANLTSPCNQHLARAAHNVLLSLPKYEFDRGDHSNANWNEWYSEDKHTGINFNWQYVANNMSQVPRGGYFNMGSSWGPYQSGWLTIAYQQKGFEGFMRKIFNRYNLKDIFGIHGKLSSPPIKFTPRLDETPRAKIFFKLFEKTSLFIIDQDMATQALSVLEHRYQLLKNNLTSGSNYHVVKIILPHMYQSLIPSDIGLPVHVSKSHPLVMSLKIVNAKVETTSGSTPSVNLTANITPQMWYSAATSVSVINTAVREAAGVLTTKRTIVGLPMRISAGYVPKYNLFTYSWMPEMGKTVLFHRNSIVSFQSYVQVDLDPRQSPLTKEAQILSMPAPYIHRDFYGHPLIGMGLRFKSMSDRPQFGKTPLLWVSKLFNNWYSSNGLIPYILQSYTEFSSYFHHVVVQLEQYVENPVQGFYGTFKYNWLYSLDDLVTSNVPDVERRGLRESSKNEKRDHKKAHKIIHHLRRGFSSNEIDDLVWEIDDKLDEDYRFNQYEDVAGKIVKHYLSKKEFEKIVHHMINKTRDVWYTKGVSKDIMPSTFSQLFAWSLMTYGSKPAQFAGSLVWSQTLNKQITWYKLDHLMESQWNPVWEQIPSFTSLEAVIKYANYPNELFWNPSSQKTFGNKMRWTIGWGDEYPVQRLVINGTMEKVLDTIFWPENFGSFSTQDFAMTPNTYSIEPWFEHQCKLDVARNHQLSPACLKAIYNSARFNKINFHIKHHDIPEQLVRSAEIFEQFFRAMYFPWLNLSSLAERSYLDDAVKITLEHSTLIPNSPIMNVRLMTPNGVRSYEKLPAIVDKFPSVYPPYYGQVSWPKKNVKTCSVSKSAITTFDNFTYELPHRSLQACSHVLAMDCSPENRFSVVLEPSKERRDLNAHTLIISLGSDEIKLVRVQKSNEETYFQVHANGIDFQVKDCEPFVLHPESVSSLKIWKESVENGLGFVAILEAPKQHLRIVTDGEGLLKIETGFDYVGKTCGLCGNSDHEVDMELEGPDRCVYDRFEDFIMSYSIGCSKSGYPKGPVRCVDRETSWPWTSNVKPIKVLPKTEAYPVVKKNLIRYSDDKKCFSSRPLAHCPEGFYPKEVEEKMIRFTCFDRADPMADEYEREIFDNHSIGSLYNSKESDKHKVQVPIRCIAKQVEPKVIKSIY